jgi:hypothetical protein
MIALADTEFIYPDLSFHACCHVSRTLNDHRFASCMNRFVKIEPAIRAINAAVLVWRVERLDAIC